MFPLRLIAFLLLFTGTVVGQCEEKLDCGSCMIAECAWCTNAGVCLDPMKDYGFSPGMACTIFGGIITPDADSCPTDETCGVDYQDCDSCMSDSSCGYCSNTSGARCFQSGANVACDFLGGTWNNCPEEEDPADSSPTGDSTATGDSTTGDSSTDSTTDSTTEESTETTGESSATTGESSATTGESSGTTGESSGTTGESSGTTGDSMTTGESAETTGESSATTGDSMTTGESAETTEESSAATGDSSAATGESSTTESTEATTGRPIFVVPDEEDEESDGFIKGLSQTESLIAIVLIAVGACIVISLGAACCAKFTMGKKKNGLI